MEITIEVDCLRSDLEDYFGTGAFSGIVDKLKEILPLVDGLQEGIS